MIDDEARADYRDVFGKDPEPWRGPLGALRLTLTPGDPFPWVLPDGSRDREQFQHEFLPDGSIGEKRDFGAKFEPRPEYDAPWTLERARGECEELVRVLNEVGVTSVGEVTKTVWHKDQFWVNIETDAHGQVTISDELLVKLMTESGWVVQS